MGRRREVVLVGGGHSHVQVLRGLAMAPLTDARVTVVVDRPIAMYSGMVPGFVAGQYTADDVSIDVRPLARRAGARLVVARCEGVDADARRILLAGRPPLPYDVASLNVGSTVLGQDLPGVREHTLPTRPIAGLVEALPARLAALPERDGEPPIVVVGAGAGGVELACCVAARLRRDGLAPRGTLIGAERPLASRPASLGRRVLADLAARGIAYRTGRVVAIQADAVVLEDGASLPSAATLWVPGAAALPWLAASGLPVDGRGFVRVDDQLRVLGRDDLFAVGDCAVPASWPEIPKAGVYAVRQGPTLTANLRAWLDGTALRTYRPQRDFFTILNYGDGTAIGAKWGLHAVGAWMFGWKDRIDRRFMARFQVLTPDGTPAPAFAQGLPAMPEAEMVCGGCAAKVGQDALARALARLPEAPPDPSALLGLAHADDVAAVRLGAHEVAHSVDQFTAFTDDPWLVGRVAAVNALNDLLAKGVDPQHALALVGIPQDEDAPDEALFQVLAGARATLDAHGVTLLGGHTHLGMALTVGFSVHGVVEAPLWRLDGARAGDALVLTRALGTGVLLHEDAAGRAASGPVDVALAGMVRSAAAAVAVLRDFPVHAATDVSGFGLAGHLSAMLRASDRAARLERAALPLLPGVARMLAAGRRSTFHAQNRAAFDVDGPDAPEVEALFDPQTAGGLLVAVPPDVAAAVVAALHAAGEPDAAIIGAVGPPRTPRITTG